MSTNQHPRAQLSAYLDDALAPDERPAVEGHLASCDDCRARLAELRLTASLIGALSDPVASRRLVPRVAAGPAWLAPLRTLTTLASGVSVFLFIASALLTNVNMLATTTSGAAAQPAAAPAAGGATTTERGTSASSPTTPLNQAPGAAADSAKVGASPTSAPSGAQFSVATIPPQDAAARARSDEAAQREGLKTTPLLGPSPWLWLGLALVLGAIAFALQRKLRSA